MTRLTKDDTIVLVRTALDDAFEVEARSRPGDATVADAIPNPRPDRRPTSRLVAPAAVALTAMVLLVGLLAVTVPSPVEPVMNTAAVDGFPPVHYEIDLPEAVPLTVDQPGTAARCASSFWQFPDDPTASSRSLSLCIRAGGAEAASAAAIAPFEDTELGPISQRQRALSPAYVATEVFWVRGDDLWVLEVVEAAELATSDGLFELLGGLTVSARGRVRLGIEGHGPVACSSDPAGQALTSTSTWDIEGTEVSLVLTAAADASGMANLRSHGPLMKFFTNRVGAFLVHSDEEQLTRVGWVVDAAGTWAELRIPDGTSVPVDTIVEAIRAR